MVRSNGRAALGAVLVDGGADQVRIPREPDEKPPPARASACDTASAVGRASASATAAILKSAVKRLENLMVSALSIPNGISGNLGIRTRNWKGNRRLRLRRSVAVAIS